jgi:hypothetical protein
MSPGRLSIRTSLVRADSRDVNSGNLHQKERRVERMQFETDLQRVIGDVTLPLDGYQSRFSDSLNRPEITFIPVVNAEISSLVGGEVEKLPFLLISKAHVRVAYPVS